MSSFPDLFIVAEDTILVNPENQTEVLATPTGSEVLATPTGSVN
jgi:hypothetical protein